MLLFVELDVFMANILTSIFFQNWKFLILINKRQLSYRYFYILIFYSEIIDYDYFGLILMV